MISESNTIKYDVLTIKYCPRKTNIRHPQNRTSPLTLDTNYSSVLKWSIHATSRKSSLLPAINHKQKSSNINVPKEPKDVEIDLASNMFHNPPKILCFIKAL